MSRKHRIMPNDSMFLFGETPETKMHVAGLLRFEYPENRNPTDFIAKLMADIRSADVMSPWNRKLASPRLLRHPLPAWVEDENFDIEYHVRRSALASPGDERELGILISRLHANPIDFSRPPWEAHIIEGLDDNQWALYVKVHHSFVDGFSANTYLERMLSADPAHVDGPLFFALEPAQRRKKESEKPSVVDQLTDSLKAVAGLAGATADAATKTGGALANLYLKPKGKAEHLINGYEAPNTIFNQRIGRGRRFATQQYSLKVMRDIGKKHGATINDVLLAVTGGGLRSYLAELEDLPHKPLIAFVPVNIRKPGDQGGGNLVGLTLAPMGTHIEDPVERVKSIVKSTKQAKGQMKDMSQAAALAYSGALLAPAGMQTLAAFTGVANPFTTAFNVCISNVPGPAKTMYFRGAELLASYPVSIPFHGMALNITTHSYADKLAVGFIGCRDTVPSLQKLAVYTGEAYEELAATLD